MTEFDSLQDLLEQAGYQETRIITPIAIRRPPSSSANDLLNLASPQQASSSSQGGDITRMESTTSHWFYTLWPSSSINRKSNLNRKQSEPALSKKSRKAVQRKWMGTWGSSKGSEENNSIPPVPPLASEYQLCMTEQPAITPQPEHLSQSAQRPPLRHAPSTGDLWKGSMQHHRSFPAKLKEQHHQEKFIAKQESFDGAGVVAGVGVGAAKADLLFRSREDQRVSLRQAFGRGESSGSRINTVKHNCYDSVSSLVDLQERRQSEDKQTDEASRFHSMASVPAAASSLYSVAATPVLSRQDAVAMRNVDCLDFAGMMQYDDRFGRPSSDKGLRKMRSVDALELALAKLEQQRQPKGRELFQRHATIHESFSTDSLTNEDLASANAVTTIVDDLILQDAYIGDGQFDDPPSRSASFTSELAIRRSSTPRLVITSPTGMRSPQPLVLEGLEFEPRSISPRKPVMIRPVPNRTANLRGGLSRNALLLKTEMGETAEMVTKRSISKRRSRVLKVAEGDRAASMSGGKSKKRTSKSCNNLSGIQTRSSSTDASQMSGSEQIRALQRNVLERNVAQEVVFHHHTGILVESKVSNNVPADQFDDEDDPFRDFVAVANNKPTQSSKGGGSASPSIARRMSPIPFDHLKRRPLLSSIAANSTIVAAPTTTRPLQRDPSTSQKQSGVGLACLVQPVPPRSSSFSTQDNENAAPNSLLDSPTAHIVKKRSSRTRLGQRS